MSDSTTSSLKGTEENDQNTNNNSTLHKRTFSDVEATDNANDLEETRYKKRPLLSTDSCSTSTSAGGETRLVAHNSNTGLSPDSSTTATTTITTIVAATAVVTSRESISSQPIVPAATSTPLAPTLEPTLFGSRPVDDILHVVLDFITRFITRPHLEIELKFGRLVDKQTGQRIHLPVITETVIAPGEDRWMRFESNMPAEWHQRLNTRLNRRVEETQQTSYRGHRLSYRRVPECDRFYPDDTGRIRVSVDWETKKVLPNGIIRKNRLSNLQVYSPFSPFDFRISINEEVPVEKMPSGEWVSERKKNRISYKHQHCQVDLTQVTTERNVTTHELELELWDIQALQREYQRMKRREHNVFSDLIRVFIDNARVLARLPKA